MNIDARPLNKDAIMTKYHVITPQEVRHQLKGSRWFTEMDIGHGFHQLPLDRETSNRSVFRTHEGLQRMKRLLRTHVSHGDLPPCGAEGVPRC